MAGQAVGHLACPGSALERQMLGEGWGRKGTGPVSGGHPVLSVSFNPLPPSSQHAGAKTQLREVTNLLKVT